MKNSIEQISKSIPFIATLILISSVIKNSFFYSNFGINISEFIDLSEFPLLFINDLPFYLIFLISLLSYLPFIYLRTYFRNKYGSEHFTFSKTKKFAELMIPSLILLIFITVFFKYPLEIKLTLIQSFVVSIISLILLYVDGSIEFSKKYIFWSCISCMLLFSGMSAFSEISEIESGKIKKCVLFDFNGINVETNNKIVFLGKTKNFVFIYDISKKETQIFDFNQIKNFSIKKNCCYY